MKGVKNAKNGGLRS